MIRRVPILLTVVLAAGVVRAAPLHDPFVEGFLVGAYDDPSAVAIDGGMPAGLLEPARPDSLWLATAAAVLAGDTGLCADLLAAWPAGPDRDGFRAELGRTVARLADDPRDAGPTYAPFPAARLTQAFFTALAAGDTAAAAATARRLADGAAPGLHEGARCVWDLRAAALAGDAGWSDLEDRLADLGPWDTGNAWALGVALRRAAGLPLFGPGAGDDTALQVGGLARSWLDAGDLAAAPFSDDAKAAVGAVLLPQADLADHFARYPHPPQRQVYQGWWTRGQRRLHPGDPGHYETLARRPDLAPVWQMDLWRRASERRLLTDAWTEGLEDLARALDLAAQPAVPAGPSGLVRDWTEQACALALARGRTGDADRILDLARHQARAVKDERFRAGVRMLEAWRAGGEAPAEGDDRVDRVRRRVRDGRADDARGATGEERSRLGDAAGRRPWDLWRRWGLALTDVTGLAADRQAEAAHYHDALAAAADPSALLAAAAARLQPRPGVLARLAAWALDRDIDLRTGGGTPPLSSPVPALAAELGGSQADLHALLGVALALGDMRGTLGVASVLPGTGLTRDEKRRFLYPLPAPGPVLDALLAADDDPALLLAIARNESLFEPAVRSRAGALGWMQIMPFHYPQRGALPGAGHWSNPGVAIARGAALVRENRRRYDGDPYRLLAAYNAGPQAVARWDQQLGGDAPRRLFLAWIGYTETRDYVEKVLVDRDLYRWILSEVAASPGAALPAEE